MSAMKSTVLSSILNPSTSIQDNAKSHLPSEIRPPKSNTSLHPRLPKLVIESKLPGVGIPVHLSQAKQAEGQSQPESVLTSKPSRRQFLIQSKTVLTNFDKENRPNNMSAPRQTAETLDHVERRVEGQIISLLEREISSVTQALEEQRTTTRLLDADRLIASQEKHYLEEVA